MNDNYITLLRQQVELKLKRTPRLPRDFEWLSEQLMAAMRESVSGSTLRRLWGVNNEGVSPSRYTLDVLARFVGCTGYDDFCSRQARQADENASKLVVGQSVEADKLPVGARLILKWTPGRTCVVRHQGDARFVIERAENTHLSVGDTFSCHLFINGEPASLSEVSGPGHYYPVYMIGRIGGISVEVMSSSN